MMSVKMKQVHEKARKIDETLRADNWIFRHSVKIIHEEGTILSFECAGVVDLEDDGWLAVFTEHHGFHVYHKDDLEGIITYLNLQRNPFTLSELEEMRTQDISIKRLCELNYNVTPTEQHIEDKKCEDLKHPMQPIGWEEDVIRFKKNAIVDFLLDAGPYDLNKICCMPFSKEDYTQLMQLIGYSVSGYGELSTSPEELVSKADRIADKLSRMKRSKELRKKHGLE
jgi:hypothetical protein